MISRSTGAGAAATHPRRVDLAAVWTSVGVMLLGAGVAGLGVVMLSWRVSGLGALLLLVGGVVAWRAGIMQDVRVRGGTGLAEAVDTGPGGHPGDTSISPVASAAGRRQLADSNDVAVMAGWVALTASSWLCVAPFVLPYPFTASGQDHLGRDEFLGLALALMTLPLARTAQLRPLITGTAGLLALVLAVLVLADGGTTAVVVDDVMVAGVVLVALVVRVASLNLPRDGR